MLDLIHAFNLLLSVAVTAAFAYQGAFMLVGFLNRRRADADVILPPSSGRSLTCFGRVMLHGLPIPE